MRWWRSTPARRSQAAARVECSRPRSSEEARRLGIPVLTPKTLKTPEALEEFRAHEADAAVVVAYGMILPQAVLDAPKLGCFNLHASLLPRWRGAAPINRAIMAGDAEGGVIGDEDGYRPRHRRCRDGRAAADIRQHDGI